eukprot:506272_1
MSSDINMDNIEDISISSNDDQFDNTYNNNYNTYNKKEYNINDSNAVTSVETSNYNDNNNKPETAKIVNINENNIELTSESILKVENECEDKLIEIISTKPNKITVRLFVELREYIISKKGNNGKGLIVNGFCDNKYGKEIENIGIKIGWKLTKIAKQNVSKMSLNIIENRLRKQTEMSKKKGYVVTFEYDDKYQDNKIETTTSVSNNESSLNSFYLKITSICC